MRLVSRPYFFFIKLDLDEESRKKYKDLFVSYNILLMVYSEDLISRRKELVAECFEIDAKNSDPFFILGLCCFSEENLRDAVDSFKKVKEIEPEHPYIM